MIRKIIKSRFMNIKILSLGISIMLTSNLLMLMSISIIHLHPFAAMTLFTLFALIVWTILLKRDVSIEFNTSNVKIFKSTIPLVIIPFLAICYFLLASQNIQLNLVLFMLVTSLTTSIYEEVIFRGITLGSFISSGMQSSTAIFLSALLFSLFHLYGAFEYETLDIVLTMLNTFIVGIVIGYVYYATKNILYVIAIHFLWDFESFLAQNYITNYIGSSIALILFAITILYLSWSYEQIGKIIEEPTQ